MSALICITHASQKRACYHTTDGCELACGFWKLNLEHLEEQSVSAPNQGVQTVFSNDHCLIFSPAKHKVLFLYILASIHSFIHSFIYYFETDLAVLELD